MADVIAFYPRPSARAATTPPRAAAAVDDALAATLALGDQIKRVIGDLEANLARLSAAMPPGAAETLSGEAQAAARTLTDLEDKLALARQVIEEVGADLVRLSRDG